MAQHPHPAAGWPRGGGGEDAHPVCVGQKKVTRPGPLCVSHPLPLLPGELGRQRLASGAEGLHPTAFVAIKQAGLAIGKRTRGLRDAALMCLRLPCSGAGPAWEGGQCPSRLAESLPVHTLLSRETLHIWVAASRAEEASSGDRLQLVK